jgi:hypothetical protein
MAMRRLAALFLPIIALLATPVAAQEIAYEIVQETVSEEVFVDDWALADPGSDRFVDVQPAQVPQGIAAYGPFRVLDQGRAALVDVTDERSPAQFSAMLRDFPAITMLEMIECPGTFDDRANLRLGRMIHAGGIATHVPAGGSVRSGGVELFLAGARRLADPGAEFAVHSWADEDGREPQDYAADAPENRAYLDYYREMGMSSRQAAAFYAMTNSVRNADAKWLTAADMRMWVQLDNRTVIAAESLDSALRLN